MIKVYYKPLPTAYCPLATANCILYSVLHTCIYQFIEYE